MLRVNFEVTKTPTHLEQIDEVVIVNLGRVHGEDGQVDYVVKHAGARVGEIRHLPGDGALVLTRKALELILGLDQAVPGQPPDPRRPENRDGQIVTVVDEGHWHVNWCQTHNRRMADCILELRNSADPRNTNYAESPDQEKQT